MRCDQCRHWGEENENHPWESKEIGFKLCLAIKARWKILDGLRNEEPAEERRRKRGAALTAARAYAEDGSEYRAEVYTAPDFFCALFDQRS